MKRIATTAIVLFLATPAPAAADDPLLVRLAGDWIGRGVVRQTASAEPERVYCKLASDLSADGNALVQEGRCAVADHTARIALKIFAVGPGRYNGSGGGLGVASRGQATFTGAGTANRLEFKADLINTQTKETRQATATIDLSSDGSYSMRARMADKETGATYTVSELTFAKR